MNEKDWIEKIMKEISQPNNVSVSRFNKLRDRPQWNMGTADNWEPEGGRASYEIPYDRVVQTGITNRAKAEKSLRMYCREHNVRRVSELFKAREYWCIRVRDIEEAT